MRIEALRIKNYRALRDVLVADLPALCFFVGANGTGKSTLFDIFGFVRDALVHNAGQAVALRGGFQELVSRGEEGPIGIELAFQELEGIRLTYWLEVSLREGEPVVEREVLRSRIGQDEPWVLLHFRRGHGFAVTNDTEQGRPGAQMEREELELESPDILAIKGLGQLQRFRQASTLRRLIEGWHLSDFRIDEARPSRPAGPVEHLSERGDNLPLVAQSMFERHKPAFQAVLDKLSRRVPGLSKVEAVETVDGRVALRFQDGSFKDPFQARFVSDGTIKMFGYLLLLHEPRPHPLLCIEEPENQLHPALLRELAEEFREYAERGGQVFLSTHSPDLLNGAELHEIFWLTKTDGFTEIQRAADDPLLVDLVHEGDLPGSLWKQGLLRGADPR